MSAVVKLAAQLPGEDEINGLDRLQAALVDALDGDGAIVAIAVLDVADVTHKAGGDSVPRVRVRKIEAVGWIGAQIGTLEPCPGSVRDVFMRVSEDRRGMSPLPMEALSAEDDFEVME
ncbi:MAG: hypothetical protein QM582_09455 [Micropruina sp.]|uniref:hypothetical protein n=1 Tax=Micropruina sp. TaxID=2737536 RepID=UPI0039E59380